MKIYSILILQQNADKAGILASQFDLSSFGYFQRSSIQEFMNFTAMTIAERTQPGQRQSVESETNVVHVYRHARGPVGAVMSDKEYPSRVVFSLLNKIMDEFLVKFPQDLWNAPVQYPELAEYLCKYQDPKQADIIMRVQSELDETTAIIHKTMESLLQRGEQLDALVNKSEMLSGQTKMFYKAAKKTNSCCIVM